MRMLLAVTALVLALAPARGDDREREASPDSIAERLDGARRVAYVRSLLSSNDRRLRAWGCSIVSELQIAALAPDALAALRREKGERLSEESLIARSLALDALVRVGSRAPPADLLPHARGALSGAVLRLFADRPRACVPELTRLFEREASDDSWIAAGNLLLEVEAPGFAASLLAGLETHVELLVATRPVGTRRAPTGSVPVCGPRSELARDGWPRPVFHVPSAEAPRVERIRPCGGVAPIRPYPALERGPRAVRIRRTESQRAYLLAAVERRDRDACRAEWIQALLVRHGARAPEGGVRDEHWWRLRPVECATAFGPPARMRVQLRWAGAQPLLRQASRERSALVVTWRHTVGRLRAAGLLTEAEALRLREPRLRLEVRDVRSDRGAPLPPVERFWRDETRRRVPSAIDSADLLR